MFSFSRKITIGYYGKKTSRKFEGKKKGRSENEIPPFEETGIEDLMKNNR